MLLKSEMPHFVALPLWPDDGLRRLELTADWIYKQWPDHNILIEKGTVVNGASIPRLFRNIYDPMGILFLASIVHDKMFQDAWFYICDDDHKVLGRYYVTYEDANRIFEEIAHLSYPDESNAIELASFALRHGGRGTWDECRERQDALINGPK